MNTILHNKETATSGATTGACDQNYTISGTITLTIEDVSGADVSSHVDLLWTEGSVPGSVPGPTPACAGSHTAAPPMVGLDFDGPAGSLQFLRIDSGNDGANTVTRTQGFTGAVSGNTVVGNVILGYRAVVPITGGTHVEAFQVIKAAVTLTKQ